MMMAKRRSRAMLTRGPMALAMDDITTWRPEGWIMVRYIVRYYQVILPEDIVNKLLKN